MKYAKIVDNLIVEYPYSASIRLRSEYPNVSFPSPLDEDTLNDFNVYVVHETDQPAVTWFEDILELDPVFDGKKWVQTWKVIPADEEEKKIRIDREMILVRAKRNELLAQSDWTQLLDTDLTQEQKQMWADYRKQLRDITNKSSVKLNPFEINWPTPPEE